jgi:quercetin dioxygenase-like cupin family protein
MHIDRECFHGLTGALKDIQTRSLWPTTYSTDKATAADPHWHSEDVHGYVVEGVFHMYDGDGNRHDMAAGDRFMIPARTLHAEGEIDSLVHLIIGLSVPLPPDQFLLPRDPADL